ncbi:MAG TPA: hypothetical protein DCL54_14130 [Alphaproteobacteria bacterium]|nr:hypothetical protein [Alphaproteobacteria bacterium]HAJ47708.1 hypothetical protein [Alphaproteobacteria bacterium]
MTEKPSVFSDEILNAFLDGELDAVLAGTVEDALKSDADLVARLEQLRRLNQGLRDAFAPLPQDPPPKDLLDAVRAFAAAQEASQEPAPGVVPFARKTKPKADGNWSWPVSIAAGVSALLCTGALFASGALTGKVDLRSAEVILDKGAIARGTAIHQVLETAASGDAIAARGGAQVSAVLTFKTKDGRYCREFETVSPVSAQVGIACRTDGRWRIELLLAAAPQSASDGAYKPASGFNATALDDVVQGLMAGASLNRQQERNALEKGWAD